MTDIDSLPDHLRRPDLRPIQPIPVQRDGQQLVALRDPSMLSKQTMIVSPQALMVLQQFRGERPIEEIAERMSGNLGQFVELARGLDQVGLLWGPTFRRLESELLETLRTEGAFPAGAAHTMGQDEATCRARIESYFDDTEDPELEGEVVGLVAPHLDYERGWPNYAAAYYLMRSAPSPDRVVVLGTNHFGLGDGVVLAEYGFQSPLGRCRPDAPVVERLVETLGRPIVVDQLDHMAEHSIQLQLPWIQHCCGDVPVVAALVPDPLVDMVADDGERVDGPAFVEGLRGVLDDVGGRTLFVASSDLSHVGPQFGEPRAVDERRRLDVEQHDRDVLGKFVSGDHDEFLAAMRWTRNPTRWCSIGNMAALLQLARPERVELIDYRQACDEKGHALVSSIAAVVME